MFIEAREGEKEEKRGGGQETGVGWGLGEVVESRCVGVQF